MYISVGATEKFSQSAGRLQILLWDPTGRKEGENGETGAVLPDGDYTDYSVIFLQQEIMKLTDIPLLRIVWKHVRFFQVYLLAIF